MRRVIVKSADVAECAIRLNGLAVGVRGRQEGLRWTAPVLARPSCRPMTISSHFLPPLVDDATKVNSSVAHTSHPGSVIQQSNHHSLGEYIQLISTVYKTYSD